MNEESLFIAVLDKPNQQERRAFLDSVCSNDPMLRQRLEQLLAAHAHRSGILEHGGAGDFLAGKPYPPVALELAARPGTNIGPYKLKELIGEGGFGLVYVAEQKEPFRRYVALKLIKPGMDSREIIARFQAERQALALMDHPNIAKVFDAGTTESGRPYFVMELVRGIAITEYGDQGLLSTQKRLELFITVCEAVQHAHQKGIIHRDLKPSNVLVTNHDDKPVVKVIDFGIAKALHQRLSDQSVYTRFAQMMGTPAYMSPEQAEMSGLDVDTRSDIYSLGVLLYELLTGTTPFERVRLEAAGLDEWRRMLREEEPVRPSTRITTLGLAATTVTANRRSDPRQLSHLFRGELDWIVMKALEKDRDRRYASALDMARDVERYLHHEPIEASPPSRVYRLRKYLRRHRMPVLAGVIVFLALLGGVIGTSLGMVHAQQAQLEETYRAAEETRQRHRAELAETIAKAHAQEAKHSADVALGLVQFLRNDLLGQAGIRSQSMGQVVPNPNLTIREAIDRAANSLKDRFQDEPHVEASIRFTIGTAYHQLGLYDKAVVQLQRALELRTASEVLDRIQIIDTQHSLALAYCYAGRTKEAIRLFEQVRDSQNVELGADHAHTLTTLSNLAVAFRNAGRRDEAVHLFEQIQKQRDRTLGPDDPATLCTRHNIATMYLEAGKIIEAITLLEKVRDTKVKVLGPDHLDTLPTLSTLAVAYWKAKEYAKSIPILEQLLPLHHKLLGDTHPETYRLQANLGVNYRDAGRLEEAIQHLRPAYLASQQHASLKWVANELQIAYVRAGKPHEAINLVKEELDSTRAQLPTDSLDYASALAHSATSLVELKAWAEAEPLLRDCLAIRAKKEPDHWRTFNTKSFLGGVLVAQKKYADAEPLLLQGYEGLKARVNSPSANSARLNITQQRLPQALDRLIQLYTETNQPDEVKKWQAEKAKLPKLPEPTRK